MIFCNGCFELEHRQHWTMFRVRNRLPEDDIGALTKNDIGVSSNDISLNDQLNDQSLMYGGLLLSYVSIRCWYLRIVYIVLIYHTTSNTTFIQEENKRLQLSFTFIYVQSNIQSPMVP